MKKHITLVELGRILDLDKSSVSLALRDSSKISARTKARVHAAARRHGYRPNLAARQLRQAGPQLVWLVMPAEMAPLTHPEPVATIRVLSGLASNHGMMFAIVSAPGLDSIAGRHFEYPLLPNGAFIWGDVPAKAGSTLDEGQIPHVVLDPNHPSYAAYQGPAVRIDNERGSAAVTGHLLERAAQRLLFVQTTARHLSHDQRWHAARREWTAARDSQSLTFCNLQELGDRDLAAFASRPGGAVQCSNDQGALRVWHRLNRLGISVPRQVLLAGFDGNEAGELIGLTTAVFDAARMAETGWEMLAQLMWGWPAEPVARTVPVALRIGATTGGE